MAEPEAAASPRSEKTFAPRNVLSGNPGSDAELKSMVLNPDSPTGQIDQERFVGLDENVVEFKGEPRQLVQLVESLQQQPAKPGLNPNETTTKHRFHDESGPAPSVEVPLARTGLQLIRRSEPVDSGHAKYLQGPPLDAEGNMLTRWEVVGAHHDKDRGQTLLFVIEPDGISTSVDTGMESHQIINHVKSMLSPANAKGATVVIQTSLSEGERLVTATEPRVRDNAYPGNPRVFSFEGEGGIELEFIVPSQFAADQGIPGISREVPPFLGKSEPK